MSEDPRDEGERPEENDEQRQASDEPQTDAPADGPEGGGTSQGEPG
jgi:hypothetical protein